MRQLPSSSAYGAACCVALLLVGACARPQPRILNETRTSAPRSYERPLNRDRPYELSHQLEDGALRVNIVPGPCVTTTETFTRVQQVTLLDGRRIEGDYRESVERSDSSPHPCRKGPENLEVRFTLPEGRSLAVRADASGRAFFALPDSLVSSWSRSSTAILSVGRSAVPIQVEPLFVRWARRARVDFGEVTLSDMVASSGRLSAREVVLEVAVSPRNAKNEFAGPFLPASAFHFEAVELVPVQGGVAVPLRVDVERVEVARPGAGQHSVALVLDSSGSMKDNDPRREGRLRGAEAVVHEVVKSGAVAVLDFGMGTSAGMREARLIQDFTSDEARVQMALRQIGESGGTKLYTSIEDALALLARQGGGGSIVALTDGEAQDAALYREVIDKARQQGVTLFAIGLGDQLDFADLRQLGLATGGGFAEAREASLLAQAFRGVGIGLAYGRVRVFGRGSLASAPPAGRYRLRGRLVTADPESRRPLTDAFDVPTALDQGPAGTGQMTLAAGGGCNPDCYYDAGCQLLSTGGGKCCEPIENSLYGPLFASECRARAQLSGP